MDSYRLVFIKSKYKTIHTVVLKGLTGVFFVAGLIFIGANIVASQNVSPLFDKFINNDRDATIITLQKARFLPGYSAFAKDQMQIFGADVEDQVDSVSIKRKKQIQILESLIRYNPQARDALYNLYLLYKNEGDSVRAQHYLEQSRAVDPNVESEIQLKAEQVGR